MIQWHPLFAQLLRPVLQEHYEIQTDVPVGDLPRQADVILLRRTTQDSPYQGLWRHLTTWNVLEFKGRTESARVRDLDLLIEVGLGIDRRLNGERTRRRQSPLARVEVSFWYLANHLGRRFLREARRLFPDGLEVMEGVFRASLLERPVILVSNRDLSVDRESVPIHLLSRETIEEERTVAELVLAQSEWWRVYGLWLASLHPQLWKEILEMARRRGGEPDLDYDTLLEALGGWEGIAQKVGGVEKLIEILHRAGRLPEVMKELIPHLTPAEREELKRQF